MKTLILYATKHGAAREVAERIASRIEGAVSHDLKQGNIPKIADFDCIIVGSSVYAGTLRKEAKSFLTDNSNELKNKKLGLYLSCIGEGKARGAFEAAAPKDVIQAAAAVDSLGGIFNPEKANAFERLIMRIVTKKSAYQETIDDTKIDKFVTAMR